MHVSKEIPAKVVIVPKEDESTEKVECPNNMRRVTPSANQVSRAYTTKNMATFDFSKWWDAHTTCIPEVLK